MPGKDKPSTVETALAVLREAGTPMTFAELMNAVNAVAPIRTRNPKNTLRSAIFNTDLIQSTGDGRFGYLLALVTGATLRQPLTAEDLQRRRIVLTDEVQTAVYPAAHEMSAKRQDDSPRTFALPNGAAFAAAREFFGPFRFGIQGDATLWDWLKQQGAQAGDALLVHVVDSEAWQCRLTFEPRSVRNEEQIARRNAVIADAAHEVLKATHEGLFWFRLAARVLARGVYRDPCPPDPLTVVLLQRDTRFRGKELGGVALATRYDRIHGEFAPDRPDPIESLLQILYPPVPPDPAKVKIIALLAEGRVEEAREAMKQAGIAERRGDMTLMDMEKSILSDPVGAVISLLLGGGNPDLVEPPPRPRQKVDRKTLAKRVYRFKAQLAHRKKRAHTIEIRGDQTMGVFDDVMREAFDHDTWDHLSEFYMGRDRDWRRRGLGIIEPFGGGEGSGVVIGELGLETGDELRYVYDFGDDVQHILILEAVGEAQKGVTYPRIVA